MHEKTVKEIMKTVVETLERNDTLDIADEVMAQDRIRHMPVLDLGRVVGVVSQRDLLQRALVTVFGYGDVSAKKLLHTIRVKEVMSEPVITVSPDATVKEAVGLMLRYKIGCLPVVRDGTLVGIVTETDMMRELVGPVVKDDAVVVFDRH